MLMMNTSLLEIVISTNKAHFENVNLLDKLKNVYIKIGSCQINSTSSKHEKKRVFFTVY